VQQQYPVNTISIFIQAPSVDELKIRLQNRGSESKSSINARVNKAAYEMTFNDQFDYVIINEEFNKACADTEKIVTDFINK
jgi:guanylate kinase